ncbi:MAG: AAA family ATPase [Elusimicrobiaceae bacterium]|nr:AAA family ATPase [Elusimicrobiaceae bacterium]
MSQGRKIDFSRWPRQDAAQETGRAVPYLDVTGEDAPIDFLFTQGGKYGIIARANLHTLQGTKKAGKSAAGLALIVAALKGDFIGITASREDLAVLWIDTEQDKNTLRKKAKAVLSMAGLDTPPDRLKIVTLRGYGGPADALAATLQAIEENAADFVFLDGVVDLCQAFNDEEKSRDVVRQLEAHAEKYGAAILGLIHTNKKDNEARGHLGAIMQQKSAEIYQVNKEGDAAQVTQPFSRFAPVPPFAFSFADDFKIAPAGDAIDRAKEETRARFAPFFQEAKRITAGELAGAYADALGCSTRQAQREIKAATAAGVLFPSQEGRKVFYSYLFPVIEEDAEDEI